MLGITKILVNFMINPYGYEISNYLKNSAILANTFNKIKFIMSYDAYGVIIVDPLP